MHFTAPGWGYSYIKDPELLNPKLQKILVAKRHGNVECFPADLI